MVLKPPGGLLTITGASCSSSSSVGGLFSGSAGAIGLCACCTGLAGAALGSSHPREKLLDPPGGA